MSDLHHVTSDQIKTLAEKISEAHTVFGTDKKILEDLLIKTSITLEKHEAKSTNES